MWLFLGGSGCSASHKQMESWRQNGRRVDLIPPMHLSPGTKMIPEVSTDDETHTCTALQALGHPYSCIRIALKRSNSSTVTYTCRGF